MGTCTEGEEPVEPPYKVLHEVLHEALRTEAPHGVLHKALHEALHEALHKVLHKALCTEALHRVSAIFMIAFTRSSAKYTPYIAALFFTHPSFLTSSLPRKVLERQLAEDYCQN